MTCQDCRTELVAYLEGLLDETTRGRVESHLVHCPACQGEVWELRQLTDRLAREASLVPPAHLDGEVMDRLLREQALELRRLKMRRRVRSLGIGGALAATVGLLVGLSAWLIRPTGTVTAAEVLARGAEAVPGVSSVHLVAQMRTDPGDDFSSMNADGHLVRVEVWRQFGEQPKWRVEKPGRVAVMDGTSTIMLLRPATVVKGPASEAAFDAGWILELTKVQDLITYELRKALARGWDLHLAHEEKAAGEKKVVVTVEAKAGVPENDYLENKFFEGSNMRRVYRFDAKTQRLEELEAYLHRPGGDVLVLKVQQIEYDKTIEAAVFTLELPEFVREVEDPEVLPDNAKYEKLAPQQAARAFFEACANGDWEEVQKFEPMPLDDRIKGFLSGLEVVRLGEPFQSKAYSGWFIPYEIKLMDGTVIKHNLAMRKDNPAKRYVVDGGL
jgi:hypothetical protein